MKKIFTIALAVVFMLSFAVADDGGKSCSSKSAKKSCSSSVKTVQKSDCEPLSGKCDSKTSCESKTATDSKTVKQVKTQKKAKTDSTPI